MTSESTTVFLKHVLVQHEETKKFPSDDEKLLGEKLVSLSKDNPRLFLQICKELIDLIIEHLQPKAASDIPEGTLNTIVSDLSMLVHPIWMLRYGELKDFVVKARDDASLATKARSGRSHDSFVRSCIKALENAHASFGNIDGI